jgi:hypothetical protein
MVDHLIAEIRRQQITAMARMPPLIFALAAAGTAETRSTLAMSVT